jgi:PAS domain S-box-containing protein
MEPKPSAWLWTIINSIADAVIATDGEGRVKLLNKAAETLTEWSGDEAHGRPVTEVLRLIDKRTGLPTPLPWLQSTGHESAADAFAPVVLITRSGRHVDIETTIAPINEGMGQSLSVVITIHDVTRSRELSDALRQSEERFQKFMEFSPAAAWITDEEGRFEYVSPAYRRMFQIREVDIVGKQANDVHPAALAGLPRLDSDLDIGSRHDELIDIVKTGPRSGDAARSLLVYRFSLPWHGRRLLGGIAVEITDREQAQQAIAESDRRHESVLDSIADGFIVFDAQWRYTFFNSAAEKMTGFDRWNVLGKRIWDVFPELVGTEIEHWMKKAATDRIKIERESYYEPWDKWLLDRYYPSSEGGLAVFITDITQRKRSDQAIVQLNESLAQKVMELQAIFDAAPVGISVARDPECKVITSNRVLAEMLGMPYGANVSKTSNEGAATYSVFREGKQIAAQALPMHRAARGQNIEHEVLDVLRGDGSRIAVLMNAQPMRNGAGEIQGAVGVCVDITAMQKAEASLREANRRKDEFLAMLSHELRNPLASMSNAVQILQLCRPDDAEAAWSRDLIARQLAQLARLIDDLLDVSRLTRGKIELKKEPLDVSIILDRAVESVRGLMAERGHELSVSYAPGALFVVADPVRLEQIVVNLLNNAAKYTPPQGRIWLTATTDGQIVAISVMDNGIGIAPGDLPLMFELFVQGDRSLARSEGGLGIGLTLVKSLAEMHGGSVCATSEGPGKGSEFIVKLPAAQVRASAAAASTERRRAASRRRLLIVDDNNDATLGMAHLLELCGHETECAFSGPDAIVRSRTFRPDVVLLDIGLPGMDGYEVAARIRAESGFREIPIIAISGYGACDDRERSRLAGINHHLVKPIDHQSLVSLLSTL